MATGNPFDLLGDDDNDDPSQLIASQQQKIAAKKPAPAAAGAQTAGKLPTKPLPPSQAVRESRSNAGPPRGGSAGRGGPGRGRGGRGGGPGFGRDSGNENPNGFTRSYGGFGGGRGGAGEEGEGGRPADLERGPYDGARQPFRGGGRRGGYGNEEGGGGPRRTYERRSGTGRGYEVKREGAGRGNWGTATDDFFPQENEENVNTDEKVASPKKQTDRDAHAEDAGKENKEGKENEPEEKEEDKEMTLEEYEKIREEKRKALLALKAEERTVVIDKELKSMQQLSLKKGNDDIFIKLGSDKEKKKENADRDERVKKSLSINEFLKPAEGERYYSPGGGRGRGRGRGDRAPFRGGFGGGSTAVVASAPPIEDPGHFPTLGGKK